MITKNTTHTWVQGAIAGILGTLPMTIFMFSTQRFLPKGQRYDLPPELLTKELAELVHVKQHMSKGQILAATTVSHFGYGAVMGTLYSLLGRRLPFTSALNGLLFGIFIWVISYQGFLPLIGFSESAPGETTRRNLMMIAAHVIWGAGTGIVTELL